MDSGFHLAGIVPVAGEKLDFGMPWHDSMIPIAQDYLAVEKAVVDCAYAGCETIWLVCHNDMMPLLKRRVGDYVEDPSYLNRSFERFPSDVRRRIPIYYVPIHPNDRDKRDCLGWSALYGAVIASGFTKGISKWLSPNKFFVSFPYGIVSSRVLREHRRDIIFEDNFSLAYNGTTVLDNEHLPFSFNMEQCDYLIQQVRKNGTGRFIDNTWGRGKKSLPREEQYSARFFSLEEVFAGLSFTKMVETPYYFNIDNWEHYRDYMAHKPRDIERPSKEILNPKRQLKGVAREQQ